MTRARFLVVDDESDLLQALRALGLPLQAAQFVGGALPQGHLLVSGLSSAVEQVLRTGLSGLDLRITEAVEPPGRLLLSGRLDAHKRLALRLQDRPEVDGAVLAGGRILRACHHAGERATAPVGGKVAGAGRTLVMGILNVTPDSFSDGGRFVEPASALQQARALVDAGADVVDVGGESTRPRGLYGPGAQPVPPEEELRRVLPVVQLLARELPGTSVSVDTSRAEVAEACIKAGAAMINDVRGLRDDALCDVVRRFEVAACLMHMPGEPSTMSDHAAYEDVVGEVADALCAAVDAAESRGVPRGRTLVDPGFGFGKNFGQSLFLLRHLDVLRAAVGRPLLVGTSRKGFLGAVTGRPAPERDPATAASVVAAILGGAAMVRVHDVAACRDAVLVADAVAFAATGGTFFETEG